MSYLALYRKWRPQKLNGIVGQQHVTQTLQNALLLGKVSHAYLFCGPRGTGKTSTAKVLARAINCTQPNQGEPCNSCRVCLEIKSGACMDVQEIDAASNRGIDEIRELKENIKYYPTLAGKRVYIIDEVHMLTNEAFNALLKTLEDPPDHVVFILATTEPHKVPLTILSRCQRFDFRPIPDDVVISQLNHVAADSGFNVDQTALQVITKAAAGSLRDALSLLDQSLLLNSSYDTVTVETVHGILGTVKEDVLVQLVTGIARQDMIAVLNLVDTAISEGKDLFLLTSELTAFLRGILLKQLTPGSGNTNSTDSIDLFTSDQLVKFIDILMEAEQTMRYSAHPRVALEVALIKAADKVKMPPEVELPGDPSVYQKLLARLERLEQQVKQKLTQEPEQKKPPVKTPFLKETAEPKTSRPKVVDMATREDKSPEVTPKPKVVPNQQEDSANGYTTSDAVDAIDDTAQVDFIDALDALASGQWQQEPPQEQPAEPNTEFVPLAPWPKQQPKAPKNKMEQPPVSSMPLKDELKPNQCCSIEQIKGWWPDILAQIKKTSPSVYQCLNTKQVWPMEINGEQLVLGITKDDFFVQQIVDDEASKKLLAQTLACFVPLNWQIRCSYHDAPPADWGHQSAAKLGFEQTVSLFQGQAVELEDKQNQSEGEN